MYHEMGHCKDCFVLTRADRLRCPPCQKAFTYRFIGMTIATVIILGVWGFI